MKHKDYDENKQYEVNDLVFKIQQHISWGFAKTRLQHKLMAAHCAKTYMLI